MPVLRATAVLFAALLGTALPVHAGPFAEGMRLTDMIAAVRDLGYDVSYSTRLVDRSMRLQHTPTDADPIAALRAALADHALTLSQGPDARWLVVQAAPATTATATGQETMPRRGNVANEAAPLDEITIVASRHALYSQAADQFLTGEQIREMPHIADDAYRAFHRLPGVAASDYQAPFNLRGGARDEVKVQLNGVEVFDPFHMRTLYQPLSVIDPGIINEAQVLSGGFTATHGNYLSGVIDIASLRPDTAPVHEVGVSFVSAFARSRGTLFDGRGSYLVSGRRGYLDLLADRITDDGEELSPRYGDLFARASYTLSDRLEVSAQTLLAQDDVTFFDGNDGEDFREDGSLRYIWLMADAEPVPGVRAVTSVFSSGVDTTEDGSQLNLPAEDIQRYFDRDIDISGVQTEWTIPIGDRQLIYAGGRYRDLSAHFDYRLNSLRRSAFVDNGAPVTLQRDILYGRSGADMGAYASYRRRSSDRFTWELGLRWDRQTYADLGDDTQLSPRLNALYRFNDSAELRIAWGRFYQPQGIQNLDVPDGDTTYYGPETAEHQVIGLRYAFASGIELQADAYRKRYDDLRPFYENLLDVYEFAPESNFDRTRIVADDGRAYGAELTLRRQAESPFSWWLSYTWSKAEDRIDGDYVPRSWDQRHALTASVTWQGERWTVSALGRMHSGWPRTPLLVTPVLDGNGNVVGVDVDLTRRNTERFDDYTRVDFRVSRFVPLQRGSFEFYFEVFNVFDAENQCCTSNHVLSFGPGISVSPEYDDFVPRFPSFGFVWRFGPGMQVRGIDTP